MLNLKYCFLDIDGVMLDVRNAIVYFTINSKIPKFKQSAIDALNELIIDKLVIISTWRFNFDIDHLNTIFKDNGIKHVITDYIDAPKPNSFNFIIVEDTPTLIKKYITENNVIDYIVIDDKKEHCDPFINNSIKTDCYIGFTKEQAFIAKKILNINDHS